VASSRVSGVLVLEISRSAREAQSYPRAARTYPTDEQGEPIVGGAPRIHGELLKLGFEIAESTASKYMIRHRRPPSQTWRTFLRNHADAIAAMDLCVVPTLTFECLFVFLVVGHGRRQLLWFAVTRHATAEWLAQQIVEAFPWNKAPTYLVRDNDGAYGQAFTSRVRAMGIRDRPISPRSPWQNPYVERLIGTLRRECLDHALIFDERPDMIFGKDRYP
jgi:transposase InsO family protein